ncbi:MAG: nucleotidyltransferase family protein [Anaerolineae bacterium]|jgi:hypothetical protein|nr:nucleotidyltransferase family protein [Anaerolineae bacterium]
MPYTLAQLRAMRDQILEVAYKHGATNIRIFGSVARGEATEKSDIDVLVQWDYSHVSSWGGVGLDNELETLLGCAVDVVSENGLPSYLHQLILDEAEPL